MIRRARLTAALFAVVALCWTAEASAVDFWGGPPPEKWQRGDPGSTYQHWTFYDPVMPFPEDADNDYGTPEYELESPARWQWVFLPGPMGGYASAWHLLPDDPTPGTMIFHVPNRPDPNEIKYIFIQVTSTGGPVSVTALGFGDAGPYQPGTWDTGLPSAQHPNEDWYTYNYGLLLEPNPEWEDIVIQFPADAVVDQVVIDTICTPEPGTIALLALGGLGVVGRVVRRRVK